MKNLNRLQKVLIWILTLIFSLTIILGFVKQSIVTNVNNDIFNIVTAIRYTFFEKPISSSNKWFSDLIHLQNVTEENRLLKESVLSVSRKQAYIEELERKNTELNKMLAFKNDNEKLNLVSAKVVFRDFERWNNVIKIDIGKSSDVKENDAVLLPEGLIGRVETVEENSSTVRLLISNDKVSKVAVKIHLDNDEYIEAIIDEYNYELQAFELSLLETSDLINAGDKVVTSGAGGIIPGGILVGNILSKEASVNQLSDKILVSPTASFDSFENVFVVVGAFDD